MQIEVVGFKELNTLYLDDPNFGEVWKAYTKPITLYKTNWLDFMIQYSILFKGSQLCIPIILTRENLIKKKHSGGLGGHFGKDKTIALVAKNYYQPILQQDVKNFVHSYRVCQMVKGVKQNIVVYQLLPNQRSHGMMLVQIFFFDQRGHNDGMILFL